MNNEYFERLAERMRGPFGYQDTIRMEYDPKSPPLGAEMILLDAVQCLLVGMEAEALELLAKADRWLMIALPRYVFGEVVSDTEEARHLELALCRWLEGPPAVPPDLTRACALLAAQAAAVTAPTHASTFEWVLPLWLDAGQDAECVAAFERCEPRYPPARRRHHAPYAMAYLLARQHLRHTLSAPQMTKLIDDFLARHVPWMLNHGDYINFARWVKLTTGAEPGAAARAAVREVAQRYMR
jgi:hypothetical protein